MLGKRWPKLLRNKAAPGTGLWKRKKKKAISENKTQKENGEDPASSDKKKETKPKFTLLLVI